MIQRAFTTERALAEYERGQISRAEFLAQVRQRTGFMGSDEEFVAIWRGMFRPDHRIVRAWCELVQRGVQLWYWSNTSEMHVPWIFQAFPEISCHTGEVLSYRIGVMKPDRRFYSIGLQIVGAEPSECLFVDDDLENCAAAQECGIPSIRHVTAQRTITAVRRCFGLP